MYHKIFHINSDFVNGPFTWLQFYMMLWNESSNLSWTIQIKTCLKNMQIISFIVLQFSFVYYWISLWQVYTCILLFLPGFITHHLLLNLSFMKLILSYHLHSLPSTSMSFIFKSKLWIWKNTFDFIFGVRFIFLNMMFSSSMDFPTKSIIFSFLMLDIQLQYFSNIPPLTGY